MQTLASSNSERAFIGAILNGDTRATEHGLRLSDFSDDLCRAAFSACLQLEAQGKQADLVTMFDTFPDIDSGALITLTQEAAVGGSLADQHAANIRNAGQRRRITELFLKAAQAAQDASQPLEDTITKTRTYLDKAAEQTSSDDSIDGEDAIIDFLLWIDDDTPEKVIPTGIPCLDSKLGGGLKGGRFYVIGARPSVGKSALMTTWATNAIKNGFRALYVSMEMGSRENIGRMAAAVSGVSMTRIGTKALLSNEDKGQIVESFHLLPGSRFRFSTKARTPDTVRRAALKMQATGGLDIVFVDYIQLLQPDQRVNSRVEGVGEITRALKLLAMELNIPIVAAAQLNRVAANTGNPPRLSDLRESGSIEQDADCVILLHRPDDQLSQPIKKIELCVAKHRQGSCGKTELMFDGALMRFVPIDDRYKEAG